MDSVLILILCLCAFIGILLVGYQLNYNYNESLSFDTEYIVVGKTLVSLSESQKEVCVLEDDENIRIQANGDNGCNYNIGDKVLVHITKNGNNIKELLN